MRYAYFRSCWNLSQTSDVHSMLVSSPYFNMTHGTVNTLSSSTIGFTLEQILQSHNAIIKTSVHSCMTNVSGSAQASPLSQNDWHARKCCKTFSDLTDYNTIDESKIQSQDFEADELVCCSHEIQKQKSCTVLKQSPSLSQNGEEIVTTELNRTVSLPIQNSTCSVSEIFGSSNISPDPAARREPGLSTQSVMGTDVPSACEHTFPLNPGIITGTHVSYHNDNSFGGARPKIVASRKLKTNYKQNNFSRSVNQSDEGKANSFIDEQTYQHYRNSLLSLKTPNSPTKSSAVGAVLFMNVVSQTLIDMAVNLLWVKLGCCPTAVQLYSAICNCNNDERSFVLEFIELCHTEKGKSAIETLQIDQHFDQKTGNSLSQVSTSMPSLGLSSLSDNNYLINSRQGHPPSIKSCQQNYSTLSNSKQQTSLLATSEKQQHSLLVNQTQQISHSHMVEPLRALDFHIPALDFQFQEHYSDHQFPADTTSNTVQTVPQINNQTPEKQQTVLLTKQEMQRLKVQVLQKEHKYLMTSMMCVICRNKPVEITLLPCGHFVLCAACSENCSICPVCSKEALAEVKTFLC